MGGVVPTYTALRHRLWARLLAGGEPCGPARAAAACADGWDAAPTRFQNTLKFPNTLTGLTLFFPGHCLVNFPSPYQLRLSCWSARG